MVTLRTPHAKNQPPRLKTVAYRPRTDRHTHRQTDRQTEKANTEDPFFRKKFFLIFDFLFKERSDKYIQNKCKQARRTAMDRSNIDIS